MSATSARWDDAVLDELRRVLLPMTHPEQAEARWEALERLWDLRGGREQAAEEAWTLATAMLEAEGYRVSGRPDTDGAWAVRVQDVRGPRVSRLQILRVDREGAALVRSGEVVLPPDHPVELLREAGRRWRGWCPDVSTRIERHAAVWAMEVEIGVVLAEVDRWLPVDWGVDDDGGLGEIALGFSCLARAGGLPGREGVGVSGRGRSRCVNLCADLELDHRVRFRARWVRVALPPSDVWARVVGVAADPGLLGLKEGSSGARVLAEAVRAREVALPIGGAWAEVLGPTDGEAVGRLREELARVAEHEPRSGWAWWWARHLPGSAPAGPRPQDLTRWAVREAARGDWWPIPVGEHELVWGERHGAEVMWVRGDPHPAESAPFPGGVVDGEILAAARATLIDGQRVGRLVERLIVLRDRVTEQVDVQSAAAAWSRLRVAILGGDAGEPEGATVQVVLADVDAPIVLRGLVHGEHRLGRLELRPHPLAALGALLGAPGQTPEVQEAAREISDKLIVLTGAGPLPPGSFARWLGHITRGAERGERQATALAHRIVACARDGKTGSVPPERLLAEFPARLDLWAWLCAAYRRTGDDRPWTDSRLGIELPLTEREVRRAIEAHLVMLWLRGNGDYGKALAVLVAGEVGLARDARPILWGVREEADTDDLHIGAWVPRGRAFEWRGGGGACGLLAGPRSDFFHRLIRGCQELEWQNQALDGVHLRKAISTRPSWEPEVHQGCLALLRGIEAKGPNPALAEEVTRAHAVLADIARVSRKRGIRGYHSPDDPAARWVTVSDEPGR